MTYPNKPLGEPVRPHESYVAGVVKAAFAPMLSDRLTASRECDAEIAAALGYFHHKFTTSLIHAVSLFKDQRDMPKLIPSDPLECCRAALKQRGL